jgi:hypothetical protein
MDYAQMLHDVSRVLNDRSTAQTHLELIQRIGGGDTKAVLSLLPMEFKDDDQRKRFLQVVNNIYVRARRNAEQLYHASLAEVQIYQEIEQIWAEDDELGGLLGRMSSQSQLNFLTHWLISHVGKKTAQEILRKMGDMPEEKKIQQLKKLVNKFSGESSASSSQKSKEETTPQGGTPPPQPPASSGTVPSKDYGDKKDIKVPRVSSKVRKLVWVGLICGVLVIFALLILIYYVRQKRRWGDVYSLNDLLRDLWRMFKSALRSFVDELMRALVKVLATVIVVTICCMIVIYLLPPVDQQKLNSPVRWLVAKIQSLLTKSSIEAVTTQNT